MNNPHLNELEEIAELLKILGDKTRLTLFSLLKVRELCVCELTELLDVSQPAISQHLRKLKLLNLVKERKQGQWVYYSLRKPNEDETMLQTLIEHLPDLSEWLTCLDLGESCNFPINENKKKSL
ncbi:metalloregulator ArsR/SmtB family transcription factor [Tepidibacillus sp. HK-1]|uniref:ArsR/SmtB family transcription factor n=1 Tax=Tepidibacillus sp. HK-1 TaxID=1883407 RepID=UPI000853169D|nr:metalloregulator ArsR/SmtB family transcription factor [Tepidibacillus sp. HK-1]GBF10471.1 HTH-type transcriptional repressor AseR [Tepidibacillus sp. HK-1]